MLIHALDDSAISKTSGGTLNNVQQAIVCGVCLESDVNRKSLFDFDKGEIEKIKKELTKLREFVNSEMFGKVSFLPYAQRLPKAFKKNNIKYDVSNESMKKFTKGLILNETKKIEKFLKDYKSVFEHSHYLEDSSKLINDVLNELKKIEADVKAGRKTLEDFDELANMYGCAAGGTKMGYCKFNFFLRYRHFKSMSPQQYADMCKKVKTLRDGLVARSGQLNEEDITLYRYTDINGVIGMLSGSGVISKDWNNKLYSKMKKKYELEGKTYTMEEHYKVLREKTMELLDKKPVISDRAFLSTSRSETATSKFGSTKLIINGKKGTVRAGDISKLSGHPQQQEVLFAPSQKFRVKVAQDTTLVKRASRPCFEIELETI